MMKKVIAIGMVTATILCAQNLPYRIYMGTFSQPNNDAAVNAELQRIRQNISADAMLKAGMYVYEGKKTLFVDTQKVSYEQAQEILDKVRQIPGFSSAYIRARSVKETDAVAVAPAITVNENNQIVHSNLPIATARSDVKGLLKLDEVVRSVLNENPGLKETEFNYLQVGKDLKMAKNAYYPTLDATSSVGYERKRLDDGSSTRDGDGRVTNATLTLTENLYNGGADKNRIVSQNARLDSAAYSVAQAADRLTLNTTNAYIQVIKTKKILEIEELNVKNHEQIYAQIKDRAQSGYGVASEERQAGSRYTLAQSNLIAAQNNYEDAISTFEKLYGKKVNAENLVMPDFTLPLPRTEKEVYDKAMLCNPSLLVQRSNIAMAESVVREKKAPFLPKLDLVISGGYEHTGVLYDNREENTFDALLRLNYNLYNKGNDKLDREKSQLAVQQENQTLDNLTRELRESLKFSWQNYTLEQEKMGYLVQHVEFAKATLDSYQDEFRIGRRDLINLLDAESEYNTALKEIINTETALLYAKFRLLDNMGMIADSFEPGFAKRYIQGACSIQSDLR